MSTFLVVAVVVESVYPPNTNANQIERYILRYFFVEIIRALSGT